MTIINNRIGEKNLEFIVDIDPDLPYEVLGDSIRIKQIIINLVNNAVKFTKQGMVKLKISHEYIDYEKILLKICVIDTGIGIKKEDMDKLFEQFEQLDMDKNKGIEGSGLGLAIVSGFVKLMNGKIRVESEYGKGSEFVVSLPLASVTHKS